MRQPGSYPWGISTLNWFNIRIFSEWSDTNFWVIPKEFWISSISVFLYTAKFSVQFDPRWMAAFVEDDMDNPTLVNWSSRLRSEMLMILLWSPIWWNSGWPFPSIVGLGFACVCPHFASVSTRVWSPNIRFSLPASRNLNFECFPVAALESECSDGYRLVFFVCFQTHVETPPCSASAFPGLSESLISCGESFFALNTLYGAKLLGLGFDITKFIDLGFAIAELSLEVPSCPFFDIALSPRCFLFERNKWPQENIGKFTMSNKRRRWFHSSRVKLPLVNMSASWFLDIFDLDSWLQVDPVKQPITCNSVDSWHVSHCWTSAFDNHLDNCFVIFKNVQLRLALRRMCVRWNVIQMWQRSTSRFPFRLVLDVFRERSPVSHLFPDAGLVGVLVLFVERNTSITTSHKSTTKNPSICSPASNEIISDSVELWDTDVCFLHIQRMVTNARLPKKHKNPPKSTLSPHGHQQNLSPRIYPVDNAEPCCPHDNVDGSHLSDECMMLILANVCHKLVPI